MLSFSPSRRPESRFVVGLLVAVAPVIASAGGVERGPAKPARLDAQVAWQIHLPSGQTKLFSSYTLLDGRIYAIGTDGVVTAVRADNGEVSWLRRLADEGEQLWPPVAYHSAKGDFAAFTRLDKIVMVEPKSGVPMHFLTTTKPNNGPAAFSQGHAYVTSAGTHLAVYRLKDDYIFWRASFDAMLDVPPVYVPGLNIVVAADHGGLVAGLRNVDRADHRNVFRQNLRARPEGWLALDGSMLYLSTDNQLLHALALSPSGEKRREGEIVWQYRLNKPPEGGPILTETAIYQATQGGGLHRLPKFPGEFKAWYAPNAKQFLAEWPQGVVVLTNDGKLNLIHDDPARPVAVAEAAGFSTGIANSWNDAVFLTTPAGDIRCIRPADAAPLKLASFVPASAPASGPAEEERETFLERIRREAQEGRIKRGKAPRPPAEPNIPAAQSRPAEAAPAGPQLPYDPLRSNIPVVK